MAHEIGITALIKTAIDKTSLQTETMEMERELEDKGELQLSPDTDFMERKLEEWARDFGLGFEVGAQGAEGGVDMPGDSFSASHLAAEGIEGGDFQLGRGGEGGLASLASGGATDAVAGKLGQKMGGIGSLGKLGKVIGPLGLGVTLAGGLAWGIFKGIQKLAKHSPTLSASLEILKTAKSMFFLPFGRWAGTWLMPWTKAFLKFSSSWIEWSEKGLLYTLFEAGKYIITGIVKGIAGYFAQKFGNLLSGDEKSGRSSGGALGSLAGAGIGFLIGGPIGAIVGMFVGNLIGQLTGFLIGKLNEVDWNQIALDMFGPAGEKLATTIHELFPDLTAGEFLASMAFPALSAALLLKELNWDAAASVVSTVKTKLGNLGNPLDTLKGATTGLKNAFVGFIKWLNKTVPGLNIDTNTGKTVDTSRGEHGGPGGSRGGTPSTSYASFRQGEAGTLKEVPQTFPISGGGGGGPGDLKVTPMATGGFVQSPTPALIGEAGPEAVIPLDRFEQMVRSSINIEMPAQGLGGGADLSALEAKLDAVIDAIENAGGDTVLEVDGKTLAETSENARERFLSRRDVVR